ncbi:MAG: cytochrome C oxidase subunit IV family protein [Thiovulaceae bacterium]|nr:cytochrome C oxidase subunit IV family protein [Sulfurimonadaceae bacterium]
MKKSLEGVWAVLIIFTIFAYLLGELKLVNTLLVDILLITTFIKGQLVIDYFMGLKNVQLRYSIIPTLWLSIVIFSIALAYYLPITIK